MRTQNGWGGLVAHLLLLAGALLIGLFLGRFVLPATGSIEELRVRRLVLLDRSGERARAILEAGASPQLVFLDAQGKRRTAVGVHDHPTDLDDQGREYSPATAFLELLDPAGTRRLVAEQGQGQGPSLALRGEEGLDRWNVRLLLGETWMSFLAADDDTRASDRLTITSGAVRPARIQIRSPDGDVAWSTPGD